ncbi:MAG TPA: hypothetical protein VF614_05490 [Chthoniobacteraceae bacterium]|jgi:hypothetical protein
MNIVPLACTRLLTAVFLVSGLPAPSAARELEDNAGEMAVPSPDRRFVFRKLQGNDDGNVFGVIDGRSGKPLPIDGETLHPMSESVRALWSPNSKRLAVNARLGGRYETVELFQWTGKKFKQLGDIEKMMSGAVYAEIDRQLKAEGLPKDIYLRRIWDTFEVTRWIDDSTLEAQGYTSRTFVREQPDAEPEDISSDLLFTLKIDKKGRLKIASKKPAPQQTDEETAPEPEAQVGQNNEAAGASGDKPTP